MSVETKYGAIQSDASIGQITSGNDGQTDIEFAAIIPEPAYEDVLLWIEHTTDNDLIADGQLELYLAPYGNPLSEYRKQFPRGYTLIEINPLSSGSSASTWVLNVHSMKGIFGAIPPAVKVRIQNNYDRGATPTVFFRAVIISDV